MIPFSAREKAQRRPCTCGCDNIRLNHSPLEELGILRIVGLNFLLGTYSTSQAAPAFAPAISQAWKMSPCFRFFQQAHGLPRKVNPHSDLNPKPQSQKRTQLSERRQLGARQISPLVQVVEQPQAERLDVLSQSSSGTSMTMFPVVLVQLLPVPWLP